MTEGSTKIFSKSTFWVNVCFLPANLSIDPFKMRGPVCTYAEASFDFGAKSITPADVDDIFLVCVFWKEEEKKTEEENDLKWVFVVGLIKSKIQTLSNFFGSIVCEQILWCCCSVNFVFDYYGATRSTSRGNMDDWRISFNPKNKKTTRSKPTPPPPLL